MVHGAQQCTCPEVVQEFGISLPLCAGCCVPLAVCLVCACFGYVTGGVIFCNHRGSAGFTLWFVGLFDRFFHPSTMMTSWGWRTYFPFFPPFPFVCWYLSLDLRLDLPEHNYKKPTNPQDAYLESSYFNSRISITERESAITLDHLPALTPSICPSLCLLMMCFGNSCPSSGSHEQHSAIMGLPPLFVLWGEAKATPDNNRGNRYVRSKDCSGTKWWVLEESSSD